MAWNEYLEETKTFVGLYTGFWSMVFYFFFKKTNKKNVLSDAVARLRLAVVQHKPMTMLACKDKSPFHVEVHQCPKRKCLIIINIHMKSNFGGKIIFWNTKPDVFKQSHHFSSFNNIYLIFINKTEMPFTTDIYYHNIKWVDIKY